MKRRGGQRVYYLRLPIDTVKCCTLGGINIVNSLGQPDFILRASILLFREDA